MIRLVLHRLDRYVLGQLSLALVLVTTGLVALIWLTQSLRFIQIIVNHGLSPFVFVRLTALLVPSFLATILPITCFIVVLFVYIRLAGDRELTIMRGLGLADTVLARPALALALAVTILGYLLSLSLVPATLAEFRSYQYEIRNQIAAFLLQPGVFTSVSENVTVYVQTRAQNGGLHGIIIEDNRDPSSPATILARSGELMTTPTGPVVLLENGSREQIDPKTGELDLLTFQRNTLSLAQAGRADAPEIEDAAEVGLDDLFHPPADLSAGERGKWLVEAQRRLTAPLAALGYTMVALVGALGGGFRRHGGLARIVGTVALVTALVALGLGVNNLAARKLALLPAIWVWALLPPLLGFYMLLRQGAPKA